ncbi:hypothetical protein BTJ40_11965 [Microbulbifer sp. A4B17]|uniref:DUF6962 family protein n=1 Tax=Microbulbifer sp. A4B17 TaxID=359370 RepID=UPI000D52DA06|nr:hypothetical protein [Microbulbifer sp. A4B17]AWF81478.1 hypothetical protein BTJ40_11965 [Microbulbifer sp. A4B17]
MKFVHDEIELTTAATDLGLALIALCGVMYLLIRVNNTSWKRNIWICFFCLMFVVSLLAAIYHGISLPEYMLDYLWHGVLVLFGLLISSFVLAVAVDLSSEKFSKRIIPWVSVLYFAVFVVSLFLENKFLGFAIYQLSISAVAFVGYIVVTVARGRPLQGGWFMAFGALISIIAMAIQVGGTLSLDFIWRFNYNGIYHIVQMVGIVSFIFGLHRYFLNRDLG